jgi:hypothetical protein
VVERASLSRELTEDELPDLADEDFEEAHTVHRRGARLGGQVGGAEERAGIETGPRKPPAPEERRPLKPPPLRPSE